MYKSKKILILDDEKIVTSTLKTLLTLENFTDINLFNVPSEAFEFLKSNEPDIIITDFVMPEMNGLEFLIEAKKLYPDTCMILLTGYADKENAVKAINEVGLYKYIEKPWDNDDLIINIKNGIERSNLIKSLKEKNAELEKYSRNLEDMVKSRTEDLLSANQKLNTIISYCADGIMVLSEENKITSANQSAESLCGMSEKLFVNRDINDILYVCDGIFTDKINSKFGIIQDVTIKNAVNGREILTDVSYSKIDKENNIVLVIRDMSAQKEAQRLREDFIATLTHDLRTPLLAAIQTLQFFTDGSLGDMTPKQNLLLSTMLQSNRDMLGLVNALLEVYRYESGTIPVVKSEFKINELIEQCIKEISVLAKAKNINIESDIASSDSKDILADKGELRRVIMNLLGNAINYTNENGNVSVKTTLNKNDFMFSVKDDGIGIASDDINKMFKRFSQGTKNRRSTGTGLGLYLSKQIIEAHGGKIWLESIQNKGSEFFFMLLNSVVEKSKV